MILNVLDNAIDAVGQGGSITVRTGATERGDEVFVAVSDTGGGIAPEVLEHIFDPFYTTKKAGEGTRPRPRHLLFDHGKTRRPASWRKAPPAAGATFTVFLPTGRPPSRRIPCSTCGSGCLLCVRLRRAVGFAPCTPV